MAITINGSGTVTGVSVGGLPDGIVDTDMLAANAVTAAKATGLGITEADQWRITSDFSTSAGSITANWERADTSINSGTKGTGMSESSGIFTFPSTGWWLIIFQGNGYEDTDTATIEVSIDCGNTTVSQGKGFSEGNSKFSAWTAAIVDVTNTSSSDAQIKFYVSSSDSVNWIGASTLNATWATFIRLGDT